MTKLNRSEKIIAFGGFVALVGVLAYVVGAGVRDFASSEFGSGIAGEFLTPSDGQFVVDMAHKTQYAGGLVGLVGLFHFAFIERAEPYKKTN